MLRARDLGVQSLPQRAAIYAGEFHVNCVITPLGQRFLFKPNRGCRAVTAKWRAGYELPCR